MMESKNEKTKRQGKPVQHAVLERMTDDDLKELSISYSFQKTPFGKILLASTQKGICYLGFVEKEKESLKDIKARFPSAEFLKKTDTFHQNALQFFSNTGSKLPKIHLHIKGTAFQLKVWQALLEIPKGELTTYGAIAKKLGNPRANRAVGSAVGKNPIAFIIPCHRVIPSTGGVGNYHWGSKRKLAMLEIESMRTKNGQIMKL